VQLDVNGVFFRFFGDELENEQWDLEVEVSASGGRGFDPCIVIGAAGPCIK